MRGVRLGVRLPFALLTGRSALRAGAFVMRGFAQQRMTVTSNGREHTILQYLAQRPLCKRKHSTGIHPMTPQQPKA
ncbi:hypothetical protein EJ06DRAFT_531788 [Trichodelitschia bisporula]|uniref:Uncharacterized protein n=1 Tax=Trichodelitschia bisporula TaxID=703511 RepID=A0A6G1HS41_9PEZI|nr:hypothetical protein EJ06DRAFT_531788 [Trichodelitschia bisporula]